MKTMFSKYYIKTDSRMNEQDAFLCVYLRIIHKNEIIDHVYHEFFLRIGVIVSVMDFFIISESGLKYLCETNKIEFQAPDVVKVNMI